MGRLFILGTEGYIECRKYTKRRSQQKQGTNLFIVDKNSARYMDCNKRAFAIRAAVRERHRQSDACGPRIRRSVCWRRKLVIKAQNGAKRVTI